MREYESEYSFESIEPEVDDLRKRINTMRRDLHRYWVDKEALIDLMAICTLAQEPLLLVGKPGTAKSDLVVKFVQALGFDTNSDDYFEYMLTQFTEPGEIVGPIDINELKDGRYIQTDRQGNCLRRALSFWTRFSNPTPPSSTRF